jgi:hypothetical protein
MPDYSLCAQPAGIDICRNCARHPTNVIFGRMVVWQSWVFFEPVDGECRGYLPQRINGEYTPKRISDG